MNATFNRFATAGLLIVLAACSQSGSSPQAQPDDPAAFVAFMRKAVDYDFTVFETPRALADASSLVVVGRVTDVLPGRTIDGIGTHATLVVAVERVVRGSAEQLSDGKAYVEVVTSAGSTVEQYRSSAPAGRAIFFLDDRTNIPANGTSGAPDGARVFAPIPPGLVFEDGARFVGGYEDLHTMPEKWLLPATFDEFVRSAESG